MGFQVPNLMSFYLVGGKETTSRRQPTVKLMQLMPKEKTLSVRLILLFPAFLPSFLPENHLPEFCLCDVLFSVIQLSEFRHLSLFHHFRLLRLSFLLCRENLFRKPFFEQLFRELISNHPDQKALIVL